MKNKFTVGQIVVLFKPNSYSKTSTIEEQFINATVANVGNKWLSVLMAHSGTDLQFDMTDKNLRQRTDYTPTYELYLSKDDKYKELQFKALYEELAKKFQYYSKLTTPLLFTMEQLIEIGKILNIKQEN